MTLYSVCVHCHDLVQSVQSDVTGEGDRLRQCLDCGEQLWICLPNVIIAVAEELAEDIDGHDTQTSVRFDFEHGQDSFVEDRVANVFRAISVCRDLVKWSVPVAN